MPQWPGTMYDKAFSLGCLNRHLGHMQYLARYDHNTRNLQQHFVLHVDIIWHSVIMPWYKTLHWKALFCSLCTIKSNTKIYLSFWVVSLTLYHQMPFMFIYLLFFSTNWYLRHCKPKTKKQFCYIKFLERRHNEHFDSLNNVTMPSFKILCFEMPFLSMNAKKRIWNK